MALSRFKEVGRLEYNGYRFNGTTRVKAVKITPVYDRGRRTVIYNDWQLSIVSYVEGTTTLYPSDPVIQDIINRLNKPAGQLVFEGRGIGQPTINLGAGPGGAVGGFIPPNGAGGGNLVKDVKWGPCPEPLEIEPRGGRVCKITWSVRFSVPNCVNARYTMAPLELSYTVSHEIDDAGCTNRTISGYLSIPITRQGFGDRFPSDCADYYRGQITPVRLRGFRRRFGPWVVNDDRTRLDFVIIDEEMGKNIPPANVVEVSLDHAVSSSQQGLMNWSSTITGNYRLKKNATGYDAAKEFWKAATRRIAFTRDGLKKLSDKYGSEIIPTGYSAREGDAYGRTCRASFSLSYTYVCKLKDLIGNSGLFQPVSGSWDTWAASLEDSAHNPYGSAKLLFRQTDDYIVDPCDPALKLVRRQDDAPDLGAELRGGRATEIDGAQLQGAPTERFIEGELRGGPAQAAANAKYERDLLNAPTASNLYINQAVAASFPKPSADNSWILYQNEFFLEVDNGVIPVRTLPTAPLDLGATLLSGVRNDIAGLNWDGLKPELKSYNLGAIVGGVAQVSGNGVQGILPPYIMPPSGTGGVGSVVGSAVAALTSAGTALRRVPGAIFIYMRGFAVRANYRVDPPRLYKVNDVTPEPANRLDRGEGYSIGIKANGHHPLYIGRWNLRYYLPKEPTGQLPLPPNPILGAGDSASGGAGSGSVPLSGFELVSYR